MSTQVSLGLASSGPIRLASWWSISRRLRWGPENGITELWPGTHLDTSKSVQDRDIKIPSDLLESRRAEVPPIQPRVRKGAALIRDVRLWHRVCLIRLPPRDR